MTNPEPGHRHWSDIEMTTAAELWQARFVDIHGEDCTTRLARYRVFVTIGKALSRTPFSVETRLRLFGPSFGLGFKSNGASAHAFAELAARKEAREHQSITGRTFGDPPPGFSALDRRRSA
jgi:hypothetical protein